MEEPFKPLSLSIRELFGNADALYKIPQYQRPYKWEDEQVDKLWEDVFEAFENDESNYFLGSIITAKPRNDEKSAYVDVVDGQQRLTTLMILFCVVRDLYPNLNEGVGEENPHAVDIDTIQASISLYGKSNRLKLYTHRQHQSDFESLILKGNTSTHRKPYKYQVRTDEEPKFKFLNTAIIFRNKLKGLKQPKSEKFLNFLFNHVKIIRIDCKNREFAIKLFQVLNDRGMDLSAADLIKSFLLEKLYKKHKEDAETSKIKEEQFISDWREMEQDIKNVDINLNDLFIIYEYYLLGQNPKRSLYDELQEAFKDKDPNDLIADIKLFANTYHKEVFDCEDKVLNSFRYLRWNMYWKSIILTALHTKYENYDELKWELRRFYYLYWIAGKTLSQIKQTSFNLIRWVKDNKSIEEIKQELNKKLEADGIVGLAKRNLTSQYVASEAWIKPLLILMEYNVTDNSKLSFIELNKYLHLEHVLPSKYEKFKEWQGLEKDVIAKWMNSVANITLLSGRKNIEASNNPFSVKMNVYKGKGKYDDKNEKITAFLITQNIVKDFESRKFNGEWNLKALRDRWNWFFAEAAEILQVDFVEALEHGEPNLV